MLPLCLDQGVAVIPYSPLARGLLAGSRRAGSERSKVVQDFLGAADEAVVDRVVALAERRGVKPAQIALAWLLDNPAVTAPIVGATRPHHIADAVAALDIALSPVERTELEEVYQPQQVNFHRNEAPTPGQTAAGDVLALLRRR